MKVVYSDQELVVESNSIFLAGPTPRTDYVKSWRPEALELLEEIGYKGQVLVPEHQGKTKYSFLDQVEWEDEGLLKCAVIVFWIPRDLKTMPALTTNIEFGRFVCSGKIVYGRQNDAPKNGYLDWLYQKYTKHLIIRTLKDLMIVSSDMANQHSVIKEMFEKTIESSVISVLEEEQENNGEIL